MARTLRGNTERFQTAEWIADNNVWDPGALQNGQGFTQTVRVEESTFPNGVTMQWAWPYDRTLPLTYEAFPVRSYPMVTHGLNPWRPDPSTTPDFPRRLDTVQDLSVTFDTTRAGDGHLHNVALSLWISDDPSKGLAGLTDEVMVWLHDGYFGPAGAPIGRYQDATGPATLWNRPDHGDPKVPERPHWEYTAVNYDKDVAKGTVDLDGVLDELQGRGIVEPGDWLLGVQFGAEVAGGTGSLSIDRLDVDLTPAPPPVGLPVAPPPNPFATAGTVIAA